MKSVWTVARHELRGFFDQATAYILIIAFLALGLFLTFRSLYASNMATLRPLFDLLPWLFAILIPAATMRSLAEERRSGTLDWLIAHPLGEIEAVGGKFLGNWLFALAALAGTLPTAVGVLLASEADPGIIVAQYVGAALLAAQFVAIGLWASSMTRNQITSFILGVGRESYAGADRAPGGTDRPASAPERCGCEALGRRALRERGPRRDRPKGRALLPVHGGAVSGLRCRAREPRALEPWPS